jgi:hypothetical protein
MPETTRNSPRANATTVAALATLAAQVEELNRRFNRIETKSEETHDAVISIQTTLTEQKFGERLQALNDRLDKGLGELRSDFVHALSSMRAEGGQVVDGINARIDKHEDRLDKLEGEGHRAAGAGTIIGWLTTHGLTIVVSAFTAIVAFLGLKVTHH